MVVIILPLGGEFPRRRQTLELFQGQELVPQATVEAFDVTVFPGAAWLDVERLDADLGEPLPQRLGDELGAL